MYPSVDDLQMTAIGKSATDQPYTVVCVSTDDALVALQAEWRRLVGDHPFLSWDWCECWWWHYRTSRTKLWVLTVRDASGRLVGLAPWLLSTTLTQGRVVRFLGSNEVCGDRLTIVSPPEHRAAVVQAIAHWLAGEAADDWDLLEFTGIEAADRDMTELVTQLQSCGHATHLRESINCWRIALPDTWDGYLKLIPQPRRSRIRKMLREKLDGGTATHRIVQTAAELPRDFELMIELHQKRRNMVGELGCFTSDRFAAFHADYSRRLLSQGKLCLSVTEMAGIPAAVGYDFIFGDTMYRYQTGFEPELASERPGWLNLVATLRWAIERGIKRFDMLRGDEPYKASFAAEPTPLVELRIAGRRASAVFRHAAWRTQANVKKLVRQGLNQAATWNRKVKAPLPQPPSDETATRPAAPGALPVLPSEVPVFGAAMRSGEPPVAT